MTDGIRYINEGYNAQKRAYDIVECKGATRLYVYNGYMRGDNMVIYPRCAIVKGERREPKSINVRNIERGY